MELFSLPFILLYTVFFSVAMKLADLFDEHGMKWFRHDAMVFGVLWGIFGALVVLSDVYVANALLAMILGFLFRGRVDYSNHIVAVAIIVFSFFLFQNIAVKELLFFSVIFFSIGFYGDYATEVKKTKTLLGKMLELKIHYPLFTVLYSFLTSNWLVFIVFAVHIAVYDIVKYGLFFKGYYKKL